jgi:hypothetical protein
MNHFTNVGTESPLIPRPGPALLVALLATLGTAGTVCADDPTPQQLEQRIEQLRQQLEQLKGAQATNGSSFPVVAAGAFAGPSSEVLRDAERRAAAPLWLMQDGAPPLVVGHDGKQFMLSDRDGKFLLVPNVQVQFRNVSNFNNEDGDSFGDFENGSEVRRLKIGLKGHAYTKALKYDFKFVFNRDGGAAGLENAFIDYVPEELLGRQNLGVRVGQFKDMTFIEESVSSSKQTAVDRSLVNESIGGGNTDYIQAVGAMYKGDRLRGGLFLTDGANSDNTPWQSEMWDYGAAGRVDLILTGDADSVLEDFSALDTEENSARIGGGFHWSAVGDTRVLWHGIDGQYETDAGLSLLAAYFGRWSETDGADDALDMGGLLQVSQSIGDSGWEPFVRYDFIIFEDDVVLGTDSQDVFHEFTAGVNKYFKGHKLKVTIDAVYLPNGNPGSNTGIGLRPSDGEFDDQLAIRGQLQLLL